MSTWEEIKVQAAISALQGVLESGKLGQILELSPEAVAVQSVRLADALVKELQKSIDVKDVL